MAKGVAKRQRNFACALFAAAWHRKMKWHGGGGNIGGNGVMRKSGGGIR
jgi:hypothetical protein